MAESSPVVARWELSRRLAARRKELGVDVKTITNALGFTRNYWSAVENDRTLIAEDKLRLLFDVLRFEEADRTELLALREDSRKKGWWDEYPSLSAEHKRFYGMEAGAKRIRAYDGHLVPGILQIESYARAVIGADPVFSPVDVDNLTLVRVRRKEQIWQESRPDVIVLVSEAALRQQVAGPVVQVKQLSHIYELALDQSVGVEIRVLPFDTNPGVIISSSTLLFLQYEHQSLPEIAWQEAVRSFGAVDAGDPKFRQLDLAWADGIERALGHQASLRLLEGITANIDA